MPAAANTNAPPPLYACDASDAGLSHDGDLTWLGTLTCWLVDADGVCLDDGESSVEATLQYDHSRYGGAVEVYGPDGNAIDLHATARGELERRCEQHADWWISSERAEARAEGRGVCYPGQHT